jgi:phosphatidylserine/phosphatidylglycerophosphate/cardiolipin synthase-like enzyme
MKATSTANAIQFLMDGKEFFEELYDHLRVLADQPPNPNTYVRLAYWSLALGLRFESPSKGDSLETMLKRVADKGHSIQIILWSPGQAARVQFDEVYQAHQKVRQTLDGYQKKISVFCESYNGSVGTSTHQKMAIFSIAGLLSVLVGGINLDNWYWDSTSHAFQDRYRNSGRGGAIHDTALVVRGLAAVDIETEWLRRWNKQNWINDASLPRASREANQAPDSAEVTVLTTNAEGVGMRQLDIQHAIKASIASATDYAYFENYAFTDPGLVAALCARLKQHAALQVIVMVPLPSASEGSQFDYLTRVAYVKLALSAGSACKTKGGTIERQSCSRWELVEQSRMLAGVTATFSNRWLDDDVFVYQRTGDRAPTRVKLSEIVDISCERVSFCSPVYIKTRQVRPIYLHSKLALFDDATLFVGSANFTYRSMHYDGELTLRVNDPGRARDARERLFDHWGLDDMNDVRRQWNTMVSRSMARPATNGGAVVRLTCSSFGSSQPPVGVHNYTWL